MRQPIRHPFSLAILLACSGAHLAAQGELRRNYTVRVDDRVVGYQIETETPDTLDGRAVVRFEIRSLVKVEVLGAHIDQRVEQTWWLEPESRRTLRLEALMDAGSMQVECKGRLTDAGFEVAGGETLDPERVVIAPDFAWIDRLRPTAGEAPLEFDYFLPEVGAVQPATVAVAEPAEQQIDVLGTEVVARVFDVEIEGFAQTFRVFVDPAGEPGACTVLRCELPAQRMVIERTPAAVVERIERFDATDSLLVATDLEIDDATPLTYMRVEVRCDSSHDITVASLNTPGQEFTGSVVDGRIEGVFEIRPPRIDGKGAPAFPVEPGTFGAAELQPFLRAEANIECDEPAIARQAREVATGAGDCFEVVERLARWTGDNIVYEIPGGGSAKRTFELRRGECGGHSRVLAAMLRSLGIPARTPMGAIYVPLYGGSFGQHMWTEVWLGDEIGWLPVDCTAGQNTFVDASHIRLSTEPTAFRPTSVEVLDYAPKHERPVASRRTDAYPFAAGETAVYVYRQSGNVLGTEHVTYVGGDDGRHTFTGELDLLDGKVAERTETVVGDDGRLLAFASQQQDGGGDIAFDVQVADGQVTVMRTSDEGERRHVMDLDPAVLPLQNNNMAHFAIACSRVWPLEAGAEVRLRMFHHVQRATLSLVLTAGADETIELGGESVAARRVDAVLAGSPLTLHVDARGRLRRFHSAQGDVTIELVEPDAGR